MGLLVRKEVELARAEAAEDVENTKTAGELGGGALVAAIATLVCALVAIIDGLGQVMPHWLAALILFVGFAGTAAILGWGAWKKARAALPERMIREARATLRWLVKRRA